MIRCESGSTGQLETSSCHGLSRGNTRYPRRLAPAPSTRSSADCSVAPAIVPGRNNPAPTLASTPAWNALREIWGRPITFTCFYDLTDDQRESTSPLTLIFARCLALIHPFLSPGATDHREGAGSEQELSRRRNDSCFP